MKILGYDIRIVSDKKMDEIGNYSGGFTSSQNRIQVASDLCDEQKVSTLLHEIIEALNHFLELKLEHNVISSLESGLYQVLKDNGVDLTPLVKDIL
jgi:hypothetical protein